MTALAPFASQVAAHPGRVALIDAQGVSLTYAALDAWAAGLARQWHARGVGPGSRVLVACAVSPALYAVLIALWRLGAVAVFPEPSAGLAGLRHAVATAAPSYFVGPAWLGALAAITGLRPALARALPHGHQAATATPPPPWPAAHPALISFTSGSTGRPKGIVRSHGFLLAQHRALAPLLAPAAHSPAAASIDMVCLPLFVLVELGIGVTSVLPGGTDAPRLARQMAQHGVTRLLAAPALAERLSHQPGFAGLRQIFTGGGPVWPDTMHRLLHAAPGADIVAVYGSTEAEPIAHQRLNDLGPAEWHTIASGAGLPAGIPVPDIALRIVADEIQVAGPHVNEAYLDPAQDRLHKIREAGRIWHRTGDAGRLAPDGRLWLLGRLDGRAGPWFPFAVETAARTWPGIAQAALVADGGRVWLALAGSPGRDQAWRDAMRAFPGMELLILPHIPLDRRHDSKVDYTRLRRMLPRPER